MIHGPMGQNKVSQQRWQKRSLHQNNDCGRLQHDILLLFWNLNATGTNVTPFRSCPSFLSNKTEHMFPLSKEDE
jgi:hypothetical protein